MSPVFILLHFRFLFVCSVSFRISRIFRNLHDLARCQPALMTRSVDFPKIHFTFPYLLPFASPQLQSQELSAFFPLTPPRRRLVSADIEVLQGRPAQVPRNFHVQRHDDAVEDINEEEICEFVDPEHFGGSKEGNVVLAELQKSNNCSIYAD